MARLCVRAFEGKRQLYWSNGFKKLLSVAEFSDDEIANRPEDEPALLLAQISDMQWKAIYRRKLESTILDLAESSPDALRFSFNLWRSLMPYGRYNLYINHEKSGDSVTIAECFWILEDAYSKLPDTYDDSEWEIRDPFQGWVFCKCEMPGALWNAYCEDPKPSLMYLELFEWEKKNG